jgi:hypothetical protein
MKFDWIPGHWSLKERLILGEMWLPAYPGLSHNWLAKDCEYPASWPKQLITPNVINIVDIRNPVCTNLINFSI